MTSTQPQQDHPTELLDLYDVLPQVPSTTSSHDNDRVVNIVQGVGRDLGALVGTFAVAVAAFSVCVTLFSAGLGLAVLVVGLFLLLAALVVAGWAARMDRALLSYAGVDLPASPYPAPGRGLRGNLRRLAHVQSWRDLLHVLVVFPVSIFSFSVAVTWVAGGLGGVTFWFWRQWLPPDNSGLPALLGYPGPFAELVFNSAIGLVFVLTTPWVLHGLVRLHGAIGYALLADETPALRQQVSELTQSRDAAGEAEVHTLRRLERDLHDGPQQRLVRLGMDISAAQRRLDDDPGQARALLDDALQQSQDTLAEIRRLSRGIAPPILAEQGLGPAVTALAARGSVPTSVQVADVRLSETALNAAYFVVAEALTNLEKHSGARHASVEVSSVGALAVVDVSDDGVGGASMAKGHGLAGLADRLAGVDGRLAVASPVGGPTSVTATLPQLPG
jgi:signal transduction histidine kinase